MPRIRDHMIFVFYGQAGIHCGDHRGRYAVAATLRRPELDRLLDPLKAVSGKHQGKRIDKDGGFDARVMGERLQPASEALKLIGIDAAAHAVGIDQPSVRIVIGKQPRREKGASLRDPSSRPPRAHARLPGA